MTARKNSQVFLKSIQIQGFKSFADKIKLDLQPGLSVIVGPNGSGKSNVADAVRWVLGEQSAKSLRGNKMEDIIFAGSSARKPVGMAEVSLIFDNSTGLFPLDYEEVVITRRVYRDGEGQFLINRTPCRLKDIQELFLDTGSGKEGFSIIGQGRVEEILNLKAEERRLLIEEVAGISKFRLRKKEALKKLEDTEQNISRLSDIISEVEARIEPLAKQAEVAKISKELTAELNDTEINLIVNELGETSSKLKKSREHLEQLNVELTALTTRIAEEEALAIRNKYALNQLEQRVQDVQAEVYALENKVKEAAHELALLSERQGYVKDQLCRLAKEISAEEEKAKQGQEKLSLLSEREAELTKALGEISGDLAEKEANLLKLKSISGDSRLEELKSEIFEALAEKSKVTNELAEFDHEKQTLRKREEQLNQDSKKKEEEKELLDQAIKQLTEERQEIQKKENEVEQRLTILKQEIDKAKTQKDQLAEKALVLSRNLDQKAARLTALEALEENMEGYQKGVKETIFAYRQGEINCSSLYGTVAENIEVKPEYELALETSLGSALQNILVKTTEDGKKCIAYLKKTNKGRATFLPLDAIKGGRYTLDRQTLSHPGFKGLAVDLVRYDKRFQAVMEFLLGRIIIADNMDSAAEIARANNYRVRVVTLLGDQVNPGGSLTGGSTKSQNSGLLSRAREIEELTELIKTITSELETQKQAILLKQQNIDGLFLTKGKLEKELTELSEAQGILAVDRKHKEERADRLAEELLASTYELKEVSNQYHEICGKELVLNEEREVCDQKIKDLYGQQAELEELVKQTNWQIQDLSEEITGLKVEAAKWEQQLKQTRQLLTEETERLMASTQLIEEKTAELEKQHRFEEELISGQAEAEVLIQTVTGELDERKLNLVELRQEREVLAAATIRQEEEVQIKQRRAKEMEQQLHQTELRITRWQTEWEAGSARLLEEYGLSWEEALPYQTQEKKELLQEKITQLKSRIEELGPVNYTSLEEYPETLKRFDFLTSQKNDLVEAGNSLLELIAELDKSMMERFEVGFRAVNEAFQEVFRQLFNGGYAELQLDDPDNLLETGVKIIAQPPGKKAQLLSLLSGGERSFTAIALLFAFLKVKPSPFCLLDEIEAALDEANVKRFVQYIQTLSDQTQFILISHRRGTMESADRLYGITMEESGVSKLLTVELEERVS